MDVWDRYKHRMDIRGDTRRKAAFNREARFIETKAPHSLSFHTAKLDGKVQDLTIIDSDLYDTKVILSMPGDDIRYGAYVEWNGYTWLVVDKDVNTELRARAKMRLCNYFLRWVDPDTGRIIERWVLIEDGTKYMTGEMGDSYFVMTRGDSRIAVYVPRDADTAKLNRNSRFIVDDKLSQNKIVYRLTKPLTVGHSYTHEEDGTNGIFVFLFSEDQLTEFDNADECVADYYRFHTTKTAEDKLSRYGKEINI